MARAVFIDLAGVVYQGSDLIPGAIAAIGRLRAAGLAVRFLTNTTRTPRRLIAAQLAAMGVDVADGELFTPAGSACAWLAARGMAPHLLVHPALAEDFAGCGGEGPGAVVVGDAGEAFSYGAMNAAFRALVAGAPLLALARNRTFLDADGALSLDAGAFVVGLEFAARVRALVLGKPAPEFFALAVASVGCAADEVVMIGDDAEADVAGALAAGLGRAVLVRTGKYRPGDEAAFSPAPSHVADDLMGAVGWLLAAA
ncbi:TIGR01458 family HAD-type hydrolase [Novosphingobium bradum]|uniref:Haloacid dehalogenase-like hydrolase domain-containing protein 2 n=1 Tax=Novosphingobium bradum TaxID=1737444 RepID=A0ABV7IJK4_9SPHN